MGSEPDKPSALPRHVAIIMDGNGRWARQRGLPRTEGHRRGVENVRRVIETAREAGLQHLTLFAFSAENWNRPPGEISFLMNLLEEFLQRYRKERHRHGVRLKLLGKPGDLPEKVRRPLQEIIRETAGNREGTLSVALNYGSRQEIIEAVKACARDIHEGLLNPDELDWPVFSRYLFTADLPDPDLIIRTSGESRTSNFLLLQGAYAEYYFTPTLWPDFGAREFRKALDEYARRERRFGLTGEQVHASEGAARA